MPLPFAVAGTLGLSLLGSVGDPVPAHLLYVCVQDEASIAIIDMDNLEVERVVQLSDFGFGAQAAPHDVAVSLDGRNWYVSLVGEHQVLQFDEEDRLVGTLQMETPGMVGLDPGGETLVISRSMSATNPPRLLGLAHTADMELEELDVLFPRPHAVAMSRDGRYAYTASLGVNQLASIELASQRIELLDVTGSQQAFVQLAVSPGGGTLVASGELSGELLVFDLENGAQPEFVTSLTLGARPFDPVFAPDGRTVWIPIKGQDEVVVVETAGWTVVDRIRGEGFGQPTPSNSHPTEVARSSRTAPHLWASVPRRRVRRTWSHGL